MAMAFEKLLLVSCCGRTPHEIGQSHGRQLRDRITVALDMYFQLFRQCGLEVDIVRHWGNCYQHQLSAFAPELAEEIIGIAQGANREPWELFALNGRSEIVAHGMESAGQSHPGECTSLFSSTFGVLGQNWDWDDQFEQLPVLLRIPRRGLVPSILTMTEPGMLAKVGLNDCGLGVCLNFIAVKETPVQTPTGIPVHCLLRLALSCEKIEAAHDLLKRSPRNCTCHIFLANSSMQYRMLEFSGCNLECAGADASANNNLDEAPIEGAEDQLIPPAAIVHTNHYLHPCFAHLSKELCHTKERYERALQIIDDYENNPRLGKCAQVDTLHRSTGPARLERS